MERVSCPALLIAAPASGGGKTSITAALARLHARRGRRVRVFKCGPDFLDPKIHAMASGVHCDNVDMWICGEDDIRARFAEAAKEADLILVEGVMGLFDGQPSSADIAECFGLPVLAIIDSRAMAQTFAAIAFGLAHYRPGLPFYGVFANRVGSARHAEMLRTALPADIGWLGALERHAGAVLPERHLGLLPAGEIDDLMERIDVLADALASTPLSELPPPVDFEMPENASLPKLLAGCTIAVARDAAFCFIYPANLELLEAMGARLRFFSPLAGDALPDCDGVWFPGGYPELHAKRLSGCTGLWSQLKTHVEAEKPLLAECGGMMILFDTLIDLAGQSHTMGALLPGTTIMGKRLAALGSQQVKLTEGILRGHTFHHSYCETALVPAAHASRPDGQSGEPVWRRQRLTASYLHFYFPYNPAAVVGLFMP